jgi:hypothetical protein
MVTRKVVTQCGHGHCQDVSPRGAENVPECDSSASRITFCITSFYFQTLRDILKAAEVQGI